MTYNAISACNTGDYPLSSSGYYLSHYCTQWPCPICNPPQYVPYPVYVPLPQVTIGRIEFSPDVATKEDVKELKEEIKKLRKDLARK